MAGTHSKGSLEGIFSRLMAHSHLLESKYRDDKNSYLEAFVRAAGVTAEHEGLVPDIMDSFIEHYIALYEWRYAFRADFMDTWGYGVGMPQLKTPRDYTNTVIRLEESALCGLTAGGLASLLIPLIGPVAVPVIVFSTLFGASSLFETCKEKLAGRYNRRIADTPGYAEMEEFQEGVGRLVGDTIETLLAQP